ncbi:MULTISPECIES: ABC transporter substrate-binding protein [unclassified Clostridium]|uniref:ABC transporter substrate-binding protein n=1 Tax=unclassified Clostridium TaxID=2614128 RepID=UPI000297CDFD|nr:MULTISPECIES: ABC transporter substrate-binding protein [unclassified Clostridium]EKQ53435.1 MAG: ABC transporter, substrate-binding protein, aliphatic sulfonates family [Clostridium sp. Maddingley MBC34-26]
MKLIKKAISIIILSVLSLSILAGCGGSKTTNETASNATATSSNKKIKIGVSEYPGWMPWYIAQGEDFFKKNGVDVELVWFPVYSDSIQAFNSGNLDMLAVALSDTIAPYLKGTDFKIVLSNDNSAGADALVAKPEYSNIKDLKGKTVATEFGTIEHFFLLKALEKEGMKESDINLVNMSVDDAGAALISGSVDAAALWEPATGLAKARGNKVLYSSEETPGLIPNLLIAKGDMIKNNPDQVEAVVNSYFDSLNFYSKNPDKSLAYMAKQCGISSEEMAGSMSGSKLFSINDNIEAMTQKAENMKYIPYAALETSKFLKNVNMIDRVPTMEELEGMIDPSFIKKISEKRQSEPAPETKAQSNK